MNRSRRNKQKRAASANQQSANNPALIADLLHQAPGRPRRQEISTKERHLNKRRLEIRQVKRAFQVRNQNVIQVDANRPQKEQAGNQHQRQNIAPLCKRAAGLRRRCRRNTRDCHRCSYSPATTGFTSDPSPLTSIVIVSPAFSQRCGVRPSPTPAGVPVLIISPACSGVIEEMCAIKSGSLKISSRVFECCSTSPSIESFTSSACGSAISSFVTIAGPSGANVLKLLPSVHCDVDNCTSRALTSFRIV